MEKQNNIEDETLENVSEKNDLVKRTRKKKDSKDVSFINTQYFKVTIELLEMMLGTVPKDREIYTSYIASKNPNNPNPSILPETDDIKEVEERGWTGFFQDADGKIYILNYMFLGFLKEAGNTLKDTDQLDIKNLRSKINSFVFVGPRKIYSSSTKIDGVLERPLRAQTPQGQRITLARSDYIQSGNTFEFYIALLKNKEITENDLRIIFEYAKYKGLGQFRNGSFGRFKIISWESVEEPNFDIWSQQ